MVLGVVSWLFLRRALRRLHAEAEADPVPG